MAFITTKIIIGALLCISCSAPIEWSEQSNGLSVRVGILSYGNTADLRPARILLMPRCGSCSAAKVSNAQLAVVLDRANAIVYFGSKKDTLAAFPLLRSWKGASFESPLPQGLPEQLEDLAPGIIAVDKEGRIVEHAYIRD